MSSQPDSRSSQELPAVTFLDVSQEQEGQRLDNFLMSRLKGVPKSRIYRIIRKGEVRVNKKREKPEYKLLAGDVVRVPPVRVAQTRAQVPPSSSLQALLQDAILYQDESMVVINKPSGLPVHGGTGVKIGLIEALRHMFPDMEGLELVHRLDKGTSGCLLLARHARALKQLAAQFKAGMVSKTYHAIVQGNWPDAVTEISEQLQRQQPRGGERLVTVSSTGKTARTLFSVMEHFAEASLVQANPVTGRTHQIRVHALHAGHPIIGDEKYAQVEARKHFADLGIRRLCLHAAVLTLDNPETGKRQTFEAGYDSQFSAAIRILQQPAAG